MAYNLVKRLWQSFLQLNLYKKHSSDIHTAPKEHLATRVYICSFGVVLLIVGIVSAFILRTVYKTEYSPSHERFSHLANKYPATIYCPCSTIGISYSTFISPHARFHQVCSSQFVQQNWIDDIFPYQNNASLSSDDFRTTLSFFWQVIAGLCNISNATWSDIVAGFSASQIFNPVAVAEQVVQAQTQASLDNAIYLARTTLNRNLLAIRRIMSGNQIVSALATNFYLRYPPENVTSTSIPRLAPRVYDNCSCLHNQGCPHSATFIDMNGHLITLPGIIADCLIIDGTLASTLECYYNQSCLSLLHPSLSVVTQPLANASNKHFTINSTVEMLLNEIMIDEVTTDIRYDLFYSQCNPAYCSYSYTHHFDALFIVTTIIGIGGGLSLILRLIAPFLAAMILRWENRGIPKNNVSHVAVPHQSRLRVIFNYLRSLLKNSGLTIVKLNLFESQTQRTSTIIFRELLLTRLFILLLIISSVAAGFYTFLLNQSQVRTIAHPSLAIYQQLYNDHADTLQCPCSQKSVSYGTFLNVTFVLHQICSSDFVSSTWLNYLESFDPIILPSWAIIGPTRDFRTVGNAYFQLLATFCSLTTNSLKDAQNLFINTRFVNDHVLSSSIFTQQTNAIIESYIMNTQNDFQQTLDWIMVTLTGSYFLTGTNTNGYMTFASDDTLVVTQLFYPLLVEISHTNIDVADNCACPVEYSTCVVDSFLYTIGTEILQYEQIFGEVQISCIPLIGFLNSKSTWWYNKSDMENIQDSYSRVIQSQLSPNINSLDASLPTRFRNETLQYLLQQMFIEPPIYNDTLFGQFYSQCAPSSCSYTIVQRRDLIVVLLLLISIWSGLNKILHILVQAVGKSIFFFIDWWKNRGNQHPSPSACTHLKHLLGFIYKSIINMNLYKTTSTDEMDLRQQRLYTRIYIVLFVGCLSVLLFYTVIVERSITKTHAVSSIEDYEHLLDLYSDNIDCPCTRISIPYNEFITELRVNAFHQACFIDLIKRLFTSGLPTEMGSVYGNSKDFRNFKSAFYNGLQQLCSLAKRSVDNSITIFQDSTMFVKEIMPRIRFANEINATLRRFQQKTPIEYARTLNLIRTTIQGNALIAVFSTNWQFVIATRGQGENASFRSIPTTNLDTQQNTSCSCATLQTCTLPAQLFNHTYTLYFTFEGLRLGCYTLETVLRSSLSCFYSAVCIRNFRLALGVRNRTLVRDDSATDRVMKLNATATRFNINDPIEILANEMFIESWSTNVSYERFFNSCAPTSCTYKEYYRFDALELLSEFLSVYVGLSLAIQIMVPYSIQIIKKIRNRFRVVPVQ